MEDDLKVPPKVPSSPRHPGANEEVKELPEGQLPDIGLDAGSQSDEDYEGPNDGGFIPQVRPEPFDTNANIDENLQRHPSVDVEGNIDFPSITPTFEQAYEDTDKQFITHTPITSAQQSRLINYLDDKLLAIQREFVKTVSGELNSSLNDILQQLFPLMRMVWISITRTNNTNIEYFIKMLTEMEDYFKSLKVPVDNSSGPRLIFETIQFLDVKTSYLYDHQLCSSTQFVRILSLAPRLRRLLITELSESSDTLIELECSKLFEGVLERC